MLPSYHTIIPDRATAINLISFLTIFAIISQIPFYLFNMKFLNKTTLSLNVFFTLALGLISIIIYDNLKKSQNKILHKEILNVKISTIISFIIMLSISLFSELINADYGYFGIFVIFFFYFFKEDKMKMIICYMLLCISWYTILIKEYGSLTFYIGNCIFRISSIIFISAYNGKLGNKIKWIFYIFYPAHLMFLYFFV